MEREKAFAKSSTVQLYSFVQAKVVAQWRVLDSCRQIPTVRGLQPRMLHRVQRPVDARQREASQRLLNPRAK